MSKESFDMHAKGHVDEGPQFPCNVCNKVIHSRRAYNKHMKVQHGDKVDMPCSFLQQNIS